MAVRGAVAAAVLHHRYLVARERVGVQKNHWVAVADQTLPKPPNTLVCRPRTRECSLGPVSDEREGWGGDIFCHPRGAGGTGEEVVGDPWGQGDRPREGTGVSVVP